MLPPCNALYTRTPLDGAYVATALGLDERVMRTRLHKIKRAVGIKGASVWICLDDGEIYDPTSGEPIGSLYYNA